MLQEFDGLVPQVHETAWVHEGAWVIGDVRLGPGVSVWPCAVLRGDMGSIEIGEDSNLQDGAICHDTTGLSRTLVGRRVTVGHAAILHGCVVEDDCLIGMGAIVMDNVRVGAGSVIGAGALIPVGRIIPPGSLVIGSPGRVIRPCGPAEQEMIDEGWRSYAEKSRKWKAMERARAQQPRS